MNCASCEHGNSATARSCDSCGSGLRVRARLAALYHSFRGGFEMRRLREARRLLMELA